MHVDSLCKYGLHIDKTEENIRIRKSVGYISHSELQSDLWSWESVCTFFSSSLAFRYTLFLWWWVTGVEGSRARARWKNLVYWERIIFTHTTHTYLRRCAVLLFSLSFSISVPSFVLLSAALRQLLGRKYCDRYFRPLGVMCVHVCFSGREFVCVYCPIDNFERNSGRWEGGAEFLPP